MRTLRLSVVVVAAGLAIALAGCSDSDPSSSATPSPSPAATAAVDDFPEVDGFSYSTLSKSAMASLDQSANGSDEIDDVDARMVEKDGEKVGIVIRIGVNTEVTDLATFEENSLPQLLSTIAGSQTGPVTNDVNGTTVITITNPSGDGAAEAWIDDSVATVTVFQSSADADAFAEGALS